MAGAVREPPRAFEAKLRANSRHPHYAGRVGPNGHDMYHAKCGHLTASPTAERCRPCSDAFRRANPRGTKRANYAGRDEDGRALYRAAECGHLTGCRDSRWCKPCSKGKSIKPGQRAIGTDGYVRITGDGGRRREHIVVAEKALGRPLRDGEVVHHINMVKSDNRNCNLLICDGSYHAWLHNEMQRRFAATLVPRPEALCLVA